MCTCLSCLTQRAAVCRIYTCTNTIKPDASVLRTKDGNKCSSAPLETLFRVRVAHWSWANVHLFIVECYWSWTCRMCQIYDCTIVCNRTNVRAVTVGRNAFKSCGKKLLALPIIIREHFFVKPKKVWAIKCQHSTFVHHNSQAKDGDPQTVLLWNG